MGLRTVTGTVMKPDGTFWPVGTTVSFEPQRHVTQSDGTRTKTAITAALDAAGAFSVNLETLATPYRYLLPDSNFFHIVIPDGETPVTVESLVLSGTASPSATNALQSLIDIHAAVIASDTILGHFKVGADFEIDADGVLSLAAGAGVGEHEGASNPHPQYLTPAEGDALYEALGAAASLLVAHEAAGDPHPQYLTQVEGDTFYEPLGTASALMAAHLAAADPHSGYLTPAEASAAYAALLHANSHHSGGTDPLALDSIAGTLTDSQHGSRGGGTLHAVAIASGASGFMSGADKAKIDSAALTNASNVFTTDQRINARLSFNAAPTAGVAQGTVEVTPTTSSQFLLRLLGLSGQSGGYLDVRDNTDAILVAITSAGNLQAMAGFQVRAAKGDSAVVYTTQTGNNPNNLFKPRQAGGTAVGTQAIASQTGDQYRALDVSGNTLWAVLVGGAQEFAEISAPATPAADKARLFVRDNGAGKTQLCVLFSDGTPIALATQP
jgi:hypothetical protein